MCVRKVINVFYYRAYVPPVMKSISPPPPTVDNVVIPPRKSKAIPIVAPTNKASEIQTMLSSFEGKAIHEQKQLLGDQLFPLVKVILNNFFFISLYLSSTNRLLE